MVNVIPGTKFTLSNMIQLISILSPILITFFLVMLSLFNLNMKGIVYLAGILLASFVNYGISGVIKNTDDQSSPSSHSHAVCNLIELDIWQNQNPSPSSMYLSFTFIYLLAPMIQNKQMNLLLITTMILLIGIDAIVKNINGCTSKGGSFFGILVGGFLGFVWYLALTMSKLHNLLFFTEFDSNKPYCSKPTNQKFKCRATKTGEIVVTN